MLLTSPLFGVIFSQSERGPYSEPIRSLKDNSLVFCSLALQSLNFKFWVVCAWLDVLNQYASFTSTGTVQCAAQHSSRVNCCIPEASKQGLWSVFRPKSSFFVVSVLLLLCSYLITDGFFFFHKCIVHV